MKRQKTMLNLGDALTKSGNGLHRHHQRHTLPGGRDERGHSVIHRPKVAEGFAHIRTQAEDEHKAKVSGEKRFRSENTLH